MGKQRVGTKKGWKRWKPEQARRALAAWRASGLPLATYARRRGVTTQRLSWWRQRLGEWSDTAWASSEPQLVPALITSPVATLVAVTLRLPGDAVLEVSDVGAVPPEWVTAVAGKLSRIV